MFDLDHVAPPPDAPLCRPVGHDEDGDGLDDRCDPCPFDTRNDGDDDADGIALACDPDPMTANEVLLFSGFEPATRSQFTLTDGAFDADSYLVAKGGAASLVWDMDADDVWVVAGFEVSGSGGDFYHEAGVIFEAAATSASTEINGTHCVIGSSNGDYLEVYSRNRPLSDTIVSHTDDPPFTFNQFVGTMRASYDRSEVPAARCSFATGTVEASIGATPMISPPAGKLALFVNDADVRFRYLFVARKP